MPAVRDAVIAYARAHLLTGDSDRAATTIELMGGAPDGMLEISIAERSLPADYCVLVDGTKVVLVPNIWVP